jgi:hypothetical protein
MGASSVMAKIDAGVSASEKTPSADDGGGIVAWLKKPVIGNVPGWGVAAGATGLTGLLLFIIFGKK